MNKGMFFLYLFGIFASVVTTANIILEPEAKEKIKKFRLKEKKQEPPRI